MVSEPKDPPPSYQQPPPPRPPPFLERSPVYRPPQPWAHCFPQPDRDRSHILPHPHVAELDSPMLLRILDLFLTSGLPLLLLSPLLKAVCTTNF